jgi:hypothetical protein
MLVWTGPMLAWGIGGFAIGTLLASRVVGWVVAISEARRSAKTAGASSTPLATVLLLHSGPWLLVATLVGGFLALTKSDAEGWIWFFSGVVVAPLVLIPAAILISRRNIKAGLRWRSGRWR